MIKIIDNKEYIYNLIFQPLDMINNWFDYLLLNKSKTKLTQSDEKE